MDYIRNSKNRKLKTQILAFFSRLSFGSHRFGIAGKLLLVSNLALLVSLCFPWMRLTRMDGSIQTISAFSLFTGYIGYGILIGVGVVLFFLFSHSKKEHLRAYVPFRLSDAQAIVFIFSLIFTSIIHFLLISFTFQNFALQGISVLFGCKFALTSSIFVLIISYFFSKSEKYIASNLSYLDKREYSQFDEYRDIIGREQTQKNPKEDSKNMTLPI